MAELSVKLGIPLLAWAEAWLVLCPWPGPSLLEPASREAKGRARGVSHCAFCLAPDMAIGVVIQQKRAAGRDG
jgi:hypothetical protein